MEMLLNKTIQNRGYNFGAGPAMLPEEILLEAQSELLDWQGRGLSVLEIGHRTEAFIDLMNEAEQKLRDLLLVPDTYHVLFLGGAARLQFGMIPLNFIKKGQIPGYLVTGLWSRMAFEEAMRIDNAWCIASGEQNHFLSVPAHSGWIFKENAAYLYYTPNETVNGVRCTYLPKYGNVPLVADMTSCLLSEPIDINDYGLIFAGAQKNIANAGLTVVIVRKSWVDAIDNEHIPTMLDYRTHANHQSRYATPPTFNCYLALKMFQWLQKQGGLTAIHEKNKAKASLLYHYIDASDFYHCKIKTEDRSLLNACFVLDNPALEELFLQEATHQGLLALRGHKSAGGLRASMYNSMPIEGVEKLISFMDDFSKEHQR